MTIEYEKVKQDFFSGRIKGCRSYFENNHQYVEAAYCCIILDNLDRAEELFAIVKDIDIRANWGLVLIQMLKGDIKYFPTYFEIRNFLEIDLNILILYCKSDYVEKVIKYADFMAYYNPETYKFITKRDYLDRVKRGIVKAVESGLNPVKINMVLMKGINENEVRDMFNFTKEYGIILQVIELMESENCDDAKFNAEYHYDLTSLEKELTKIADDVKTREFMQNRKKYFIDGGEIELVKPIENTNFCKNCTRLRITPDGKVKPCLLRNDNLVELLSYMREGANDEILKKQYIKGINNREPYTHEKED